MNIDKLLESRKAFDEADDAYEKCVEEILQPFIDRLNNAKSHKEVSEIVSDLSKLVPEGILDISILYQKFKNALQEIHINSRFFNNAADREWVLAEWGDENTGCKVIHNFGYVYPTVNKIKKAISEHFNEEVIRLDRLDSENYYFTTPTKKMEILVRKRAY